MVENQIAYDPEDRRVRETMRLWERAIADGWEFPEGTLRAIPGFCVRVMQDPNRSDRDKLRAAELLASLKRDNLATLIAYDKAVRLDSGEATERVELAPITLRPQTLEPPQPRPLKNGG